MNLRRALTYITDDPQWMSKMAIAWLIHLLPTALMALAFLGRHSELSPPLTAITGSPFWLLVPQLTGVLLLGFGLCITRNVIAGHDVPLPQWAAAGGMLRDGLMLWGVILLWNLPIIVLDAMSANNQSVAESLTQLSAVLNLLVILTLPAAQARLAVTDNLRAGLDVGKALRVLQANLGGYVRLFLVTIFGAVVTFIPFVMIGWLATGVVADAGQRLSIGIAVGVLLRALFLRPYEDFVLAHLIGQVYVQATHRANIT